jgi:N-carbamoylputrescine amidase
MRELIVAATQMAMTADAAANIERASGLVREAAQAGATLILLPELFAGLYFPQEEKPEHFALAAPLETSAPVAAMRALARALKVVLPVSFFERAGQTFFNSLAMIDADGEVLGVYRKSHIPDGPGYEEKYYFSPGDTGFRVFDTRVGRIGAGICWDQWFPECARAMALQGAEILLYPTAIGSEPPPAPPVDSRHHWRRVMQGHAGANVMPLVASNRIGKENTITFYGTSFITGPEGEIVAEMPADQAGIVMARFDLDALALKRRSWGVFRDRRPDLYGVLGRLDGA